MNEREKEMRIAHEKMMQQIGKLERENEKLKKQQCEQSIMKTVNSSLYGKPTMSTARTNVK